MKKVDILVADDEPHVVRALSFVFAREGFAVETARDGEEAFTKYRQYSPEIVFLDLIMPKLDGIELCRKIKIDTSRKPPYVIILTCKGQDVDKDNCLKAGADDFLTKPFSPREVLLKVKTLFGG